MKILACVVTALLAAIRPAGAQDALDAPLSRADIHFVVGWQNLFKEQPQQHYNDWMNGLVYGGAGAGWYWTDHLKTQLDISAGTQGHQYRFETSVVGGQTTTSTSRLAVQQQNVAITQQYQFFRNRWFHPWVGGGVSVARETTSEEYQPVFLYDSVARVSRQIRAARTEGPDHRIIARALAATGFKAYMTRRTFFTADTRLMFTRQVDEVVIRCGFGVDF